MAALRGEYRKVGRGKALFANSRAFSLVLRSDSTPAIASRRRNRDAALAYVRNGGWPVVSSHASYNEQ